MEFLNPCHVSIYLLIVCVLELNFSNRSSFLVSWWGNGSIQVLLSIHRSIDKSKDYEEPFPCLQRDTTKKYLEQESESLVEVIRRWESLSKLRHLAV